MYTADKTFVLPKNTPNTSAQENSQYFTSELILASLVYEMVLNSQFSIVL